MAISTSKYKKGKIGSKHFQKTNFNRKHYKDKLLRGILDSIGKYQETIDGYSVYGFPKNNPTKYRFVKGKRKICNLSPKDILVIMSRKLPPEEFRDWCFSNIGVLDIMKNSLGGSSDIEGWKKIIQRFVNSTTTRNINEFIESEMDFDKKEVLYKESIDILEDKVDSLQDEIARLKAELTIQKRKDIVINESSTEINDYQKT